MSRSRSRRRRAPPRPRNRAQRHAVWVVLIIIAIAVAMVASRVGGCRGPAPASPPPAATYVPLEDGMDLDFSSGTPVVSETPAEPAELATLQAEMQAAAAEITFPPTAP